ncbi:MAG: HlyD family efflux transporter periplasmic adaptor subunit [Candidatus Tectomicrobia bacterium]|uniref:HlyD family efflux transporter periplasmic adaptor subunit n=1 Tax=Tectimicrobiota bacterium TaxID=2528274 RepID=A0A932FVM1_UNCTE|nr:HlyD family efflux transporter periplasmic adaptor subunit [Candidatus Tectomicrobia bacterium]
MDPLDLDSQNDPPRPDPAAAPEGRRILDADHTLWAQFAEAATVEAFCQSWLALQCRMIAGVSGGLVLVGPPDRGPFAPAAVWPSARHNVKHLTPAAERALVERRGLLLKGDANDSPGPPPRERYDVAYPIEVRERLYGVVVLDVAPRPEPQLQAILRQLHWGSAWLKDLFHREEALQDAASRERLQRVLDWVATLLEQERFRAAATAFATALAMRLECDRVSLGFIRRGRVRLRAISHSAQFGKQTNLVRAIETAMDEALDQQAVIVYPELPERPPQVVRAHAELARQHGAGAVLSIPLSDSGRPLGVLTLERPADHPFDLPTLELCEAVGAVAGPLLEVKRRDDRWLITKAAEACQTQLGHLIGPRHIALKLAVGAVVGGIAFFAFAQGDYRVTAKTVLEPVIRRAVVAPFDGYIAEAPARAGDLVRPGQLLATLDDRELRLERLRWLGQHEQFVRQHNQALANRNAAEVSILSAQIDQARAQLRLIEEQLARTRVRAPFEGVIVTGDLSQELGAPVKRGDLLFEAAPLDAYRVILEVDEHDVADIAVGQAGHLALSAFPSEPLPLTIEKITPVSTAREGRNYFRVEARLQGTPGRLRPGMEGVGKVEIDRRLLIWIWTHQAIDWLRLKLWAWWP